MLLGTEMESEAYGRAAIERYSHSMMLICLFQNLIAIKYWFIVFYSH